MGLNTDFILNELVPALRSGKYKQGRGFLRIGDNFCCLGVVCDLMMKKGLLPEWKQETPDALTFSGTPNVYVVPSVSDDVPDMKYVLDKRVTNYLGSESDMRGFNTDYGSLARLNDMGYSFLDIAITIEHQLRS